MPDDRAVPVEPILDPVSMPLLHADGSLSPVSVNCSSADAMEVDARPPPPLPPLPPLPPPPPPPSSPLHQRHDQPQVNDQHQPYHRYYHHAHTHHQPQPLQYREGVIHHDFQRQLQHQHLDIPRVDDAVGRLHSEIRELFEAMTREVHASRKLREDQFSRGMGAPSVQDSTFELIAQEIAVIAQKANEVDTLKITIGIMKSKIQRLEDATVNAHQPPTNAHTSPKEPSAQSMQSSHTVASYHNTPVGPHINTPVHLSVQSPQPYQLPGAPYVPASFELSWWDRHSPSQKRWVSANANAKRAHPEGIDAHESAVQPLASTKRPKLTSLKPLGAYSQQSYEHVNADDSKARIQTHSRSMPSQTQSHERTPESILSSQQHSNFVAYSPQGRPSDNSRHPESQLTSRGRGCGDDPGSQGGRDRKSMLAQLHSLGTPGQEKDDWQGISNSQINPDGSARGRPSNSSGRAVSLGLQGVSASIAPSSDPYAQTKKTRTKPTRNADGILIRKDGRPDMRSQSSAANLRKVHARKKVLPKDERRFTPTSSAQFPDQNVTAKVQKKHSTIMGKMFPGGVDETQKEHDYSRKVFQGDKDHTAHPWSQNHPHDQQHPLHRSTGLKHEQTERRLRIAEPKLQ